MTSPFKAFCSGRLARYFWWCSSLGLGCTPEGIGDPCTPEDEYSDRFAGYAVGEVSTESASLQCQSRLCLVNHFRGRSSCPYGQTREQAESDPRCLLPGSADPVRVSVPAQLVQRRPDDSVYCSCRCAGSDPTARYCECPSGFSCSKVVPDLELGQTQLAGSYCIRTGTPYAGDADSSAKLCDAGLKNCE